MPARLTVHFPDRPAAAHWLADGVACVIGRDAACDLAIDDDRVSRRHASVGGEGDSWSLRDLESKNGIVVDGVALPKAGAAALGEESWISLGGLLAHFERQSAAAADDDAQRRRRGWREISAVSRGGFGAAGVDGLLGRLLSSTLELTSAERGFVVIEGGDGTLRVEAATGIAPEALTGAEFRGSVGAVEEALRRGVAMTISDTQAEPLLARRESVAAQGIRALVAVPLRVGERVTGVLYADSQKPGAAFTELDVEILEALAAQVAVAIAAGRMESELRALAARLAADERLPADGRRQLIDEIERVRGHSGRPAAETEPLSPGRGTDWREIAARQELSGAAR